jgi:hypothetical protein
MMRCPCVEMFDSHRLENTFRISRSPMRLTESAADRPVKDGLEATVRGSDRPRGRQLVTLKDAAGYIMKVLKGEQHLRGRR